MKQDIVMPKVLIIDDDKATRLLILEFLEGANVTIIECDRGKEALKFYRQYLHEIVLVLLDIKLPDCKGWDLCKQLRLINDRIPIIAMSAIMPSELKYNYETAGFTTYVSKPFDMEEFVRLIKSFITEPKTKSQESR